MSATVSDTAAQFVFLALCSSIILKNHVMPETNNAVRKRTLAVIIPGALCVYSLAFGLNEQAIIGGLTCLVAGIILTMLIKNRA